ncbi:MAG: 3-phosphoshikimate 1-carboxyvinyltransferase [Pyrinomonadaceae bacterium]|jgi:3-phosphoshikimate 1-carboxyvinyltransferase|nr:3-phosphoshikimate 1-carboxyvinyltransferase [Pyrinomonadaceae bacterium]
MRLRGTLELNGDKSMSHRAAMFSAIANGETKIENFSSSVDCSSTLACFEQLGIEVKREKSTVYVNGKGKNRLQKSAEKLDCGNSGTTMRLISGILAGQNFDSSLIGDESLSVRPMKRIIEPLSLMNAEIKSSENHAPLHIFGKNPLQAITYEPSVASAQIKSCVLLAGLYADGTTTVIEKTPTRDHTERMLRHFGVQVDVQDEKISVSGDAELTANNFLVPSDISSAAFFLVAASCLEGSELLIKNVGLNPTRNAIIQVLQQFGADIEILNEVENCNEPIGDLLVRGKKNLTPKVESNVVRGKIIANLIDEIPILAIFGTQLENGLEIRDAKELRVKESDRISAVVGNLRKMNAKVEEFEDGFRVEKSDLQGATLESFHDHRISMAFTIASLFAKGETKIINAECASVSFPEFFDKLKQVTA